MASTRDSIISSLVSLNEDIVAKVNELAQEEEESENMEGRYL